MKFRRTSLAALLAAGAAAAAITAAPGALAQPNCDHVQPGLGGQAGDNHVCQSPGNAEINDTLPNTEMPSFGGQGHGV